MKTKIIPLITSSILTILLVSVSCSENFIPSIPDKSFEFTVNTVIYPQLLNVNGTFKNDQHGYGGVWVINSPSLADKSNPYIAFDASCPYEANPKIVIRDMDGYGKCDSCQTLYNWLMDGSTIAGDSLGGLGTEPLRQYSTSFDGNLIHVFN